MARMVVAKSGRTDVAGDVLRLVNDARRAAGRAPLAMDSKLTKVAQYRALHIARTGRLSHSGWQAALRKFGFPLGRKAVGENLAAGQDDAGEVMEDWLASEGHRENILARDFRTIGVARVGDVWVQIFGGR